MNSVVVAVRAVLAAVGHAVAAAGTLRRQVIGQIALQVREVVELGELDPETVVTPGIFVKRVVQIAGQPAAKEQQ